MTWGSMHLRSQVFFFFLFFCPGFLSLPKCSHEVPNGFPTWSTSSFMHFQHVPNSCSHYFISFALSSALPTNTMYPKKGTLKACPAATMYEYVAHPVYTLEFLPHPHPWTWKDGLHKWERPYNSQQHLGWSCSWPVRNNHLLLRNCHFLLQVLLQGHCEHVHFY